MSVYGATVFFLPATAPYCYQVLAMFWSLIFRPSTKTGAPEDWAIYLYHNRKPRKLAKTLLSQHRTMSDKSLILLHIPLPTAAENHTDMCWLEQKLESAGYFKLAQIARYVKSEALPADSRKQIQQWAQSIVTLDIEARWVVQRELYVQEEIQALSESPNSPKDKWLADSTEHSQLCVYEKEITQLNSQYWEYLRLSGKLLGEIPSGSFKTAFEAHRNDQYWYMNDFLVRECANRGGCCRFGCGCCYRDRSTRQSWGKGHCTSACGCCIRAQRSQKSVRKQDDLDDFPFDIVAIETLYSLRIYLAYIWGLCE